MIVSSCLAWDGVTCEPRSDADQNAYCGGADKTSKHCKDRGSTCVWQTDIECNTEKLPYTNTVSDAEKHVCYKEIDGSRTEITQDTINNWQCDQDDTLGEQEDLSKYPVLTRDHVNAFEMMMQS